MKESYSHSNYNETPPLPFREEEKFSEGFIANVYESSIDKGYLVKETKESFPQPEAREKVDTYKREYEMLRQCFEEHVPEAFFGTTVDSDVVGAEHIKIVQERVFQCEEQSSDLLEQKAREAERFASESFALFESSFDESNKSGLFMDLKEDNVLFGHTAKDSTERLYFIDTSKVIMSVPIRFLRSFCEVRFTKMGIYTPEIIARIDRLEKLFGK